MATDLPKLKPFYRVLPEAWRLVLDPRSKRRDSREPVRQWLIKELVDRYQYPKSWLGKRIVAVEEGLEPAAP